MWPDSDNSSKDDVWYKKSPWFLDPLSHSSVVTPSLTWTPPIYKTGGLSWNHNVLGEEPILESEEEPEMKIYSDKKERTLEKEYRVICDSTRDLLQDRILKNLSIMKSKLMLACMPVRVDKIECKMTPAVKNNIVQAWRRLGMYGKKTPFVACFDEYGRRLSDEIKIETLRGMTIQIVDPKDYGELYLEFKGIIPYEPSYTYKKDDSVFDEDLPF